MPWFKIDDAFHGHPKVMELSPAAVGIWTLSGTWCANYLTDGEIKSGVVRRFGGTAGMIQELVDAGLWIDNGDSYQFKDWEDYQPMKADVEAEREAARERMRSARAKKKGVETSADVRPNTSRTFERTSEEVRVTPTRPDPSLKTSSSPAAPSMEFEQFWSVYPKKVSKQAAIKVWNRVVKTASPEEIILGAKRYAEAERGTEKRFLKGPDGWLNAGRWQDETLIGADGEIDADAILGLDYWTCPMPPEGLSIQEELAWKKARRAEHEAERIEQARRRVANG